MGQLNDIPSIVKQHFEKVGSYFKGMAGFFGDPETPGKDANEAITGVDLSGLRRAIQKPSERLCVDHKRRPFSFLP